MPHIFADTSGWFAAIVRKDHEHKRAKQFLTENKVPLITSDYIVDETVTLLQSRVGHKFAVNFLDTIQTSQIIQTIYLTLPHIANAINLFRNRPDKGWSFTDCTSFVLMRSIVSKPPLPLTTIFCKPVFSSNLNKLHEILYSCLTGSN